MRTIKFRAWDKDDKRMITPPLTDLWVVGFDGAVRVIKQNNYRYIPNVELMQFTGLTDRNGKEIYEEDILKIYGSIAKDDPVYGYYEPEMEVIYCEAWASFGFTDGGAFLRFRGEHDFEVIGNIYENPELIK